MEMLNLQSLSYKDCVSLEKKYSCTVIVVSKRQSVEVIKKAYTYGFRHFGESYVQEALDKQEILKNCCPNIIWHFVGNIQSNKLKQILPNFTYLHSVSSLKLVEKILNYKSPSSDKGVKTESFGNKINIFLQINISKDPKKSGFLLKEDSSCSNKESCLTSGQASDFLRSVEKIKQSSRVFLQGFMTMPFLYEEDSLVKKDFQKLHNLSVKYSSLLGYNLDSSMGTSRDYKLALSVGAKWVRLGEIVLGKRA